MEYLQQWRKSKKNINIYSICIGHRPLIFFVYIVWIYRLTWLWFTLENTHMSTQKHSRTRTYTNALKKKHTLNIHTRTYTEKRAYIHPCIYVHTYTHTHTHILTVFILNIKKHSKHRRFNRNKQLIALRLAMLVIIFSSNVSLFYVRV